MSPEPLADTLVSRKWLNFPFWVNCPFSNLERHSLWANDGEPAVKIKRPDWESNLVVVFLRCVLVLNQNTHLWRTFLILLTLAHLQGNVNLIVVLFQMTVCFFFFLFFSPPLFKLKCWFLWKLEWNLAAASNRRRNINPLWLVSGNLSSHTQRVEWRGERFHSNSMRKKALWIESISCGM